MKRILNIFTLVSLLAAISCTKQPEGRTEAVETPVHIEAGLLSNETATKAPILTTTFPDAANQYTKADAASYGIFVCKNGTLDTPHKANSWNLKAEHYPDGDPSTPDWRYTYVGNVSTGELAEGYYDNISITERLDDHATADLYAYAPYLAGAYARTPEAIPFNMAVGMSSQQDLMYAVENQATHNDLTPAQDGNEGLDPTEPVLNATFTFRHAYALLAFKFKLRTEGSIYNLQYITVNLRDPDSDGITSAKIYKSGTFNAVTGTFNAGCQEVSSYQVSYPTIGDYQTAGIGATDVTSATTEATAYLMMVPTQPEDDELVFYFTFQEYGQLTLQPFYLKKSQLLHSDGVTYGFQSGYRYTFHFTLDNYLYLDGIDIEDGWGSDTLGPFEI